MTIPGFRAAARRCLSRDGLRRTPPLWLEGRAPFELRALLRDPIFRGEDVAPGRGRPVLLIPGYLAGDSSLRLLAAWLKRAGYRPVRAGIRLNTDCVGNAVGDLADRVRAKAPGWRHRAVIIGHSRGGVLGRALAARRPDLFAGLITMGTPHLDPFAVHPLLLLNVGIVGTLGTLGIPGLFAAQCWRGGACCRAAVDDAGQPLPAHIRFVSIYSQTDGIVDWRACLDPAAIHVPVDASHLGMGGHRRVYRAIAKELAQLD